MHCHVGLTVAGGGCLHTTHMGSVQLGMEINGGELSVTLSQVAYVPDWNEACFISWGNIDIQGCFQMVGTDAIIIVLSASDHSPVFIAELMRECCQVLHRALHDKIYTPATDFLY